MSLVRHLLVFAAALCAAGALTTAQAGEKRAAGGENHDGVYGVDIFTQVGLCDKAYHWTIAVSGGHVSSPGDSLFQSSGQIDRRGVVSVAFRRENQVAHVAGKFKGGSGSGTWSSPTLQCGGSWRAARQS